MTISIKRKTEKLVYSAAVKNEFILDYLNMAVPNWQNKIVTEKHFIFMKNLVKQYFINFDRLK